MIRRNNVDNKFIDSSDPTVCSQFSSILILNMVLSSLSGSEYQYFWVRFNNGLLEVGQYGCLDAFASFQDPDPYEVYYLSVGGMSSETFWKVYFPCDCKL